MMEQRKQRINVALAAAIGLGRKSGTDRRAKVRELRIRKKGGMDLNRKDNHDREITTNLRFASDVLDQSEDELANLLKAYDTAENDEMGVEFKQLVMTWGDQLADDLKVFRTGFEKLEDEGKRFIATEEMDPIEAISGSIAICTQLTDLAATHVRQRTTIMDHFQCEVRNLKKRYGSK